MTISKVFFCVCVILNLKMVEEAIQVNVIKWQLLCFRIQHRDAEDPKND